MEYEKPHNFKLCQVEDKDKDLYNFAVEALMYGEPDEVSEKVIFLFDW